MNQTELNSKHKAKDWRRLADFRRVAAPLLLVASLLGCGESPISPSANNDTVVNSDPEINYLVNYMKDWYFWYSRIPNVDASKFKTIDEALTALRVPEDRYSFVDNAATYNAFLDEGKSIGFGIGLSLQGSALYVRLVQPNSDAASQGILRGDQILSIDGVPMATLVAENRLDVAIGPSTVGYRALMRVQRGAAQFDVPVTKTEYSLKYVIAPTVLSNTGRRTGYLYFSSFGALGNAEWQSTLADFVAAGVTDLVVDLRDNGGGFLSVANELASTLVPAAQAGGLSFKLEFNDLHSDWNQSFSLLASSFAGKFDRLAWITSSRTCSASEALIAGVAPYRSAVSVGETTCGKPVGFTPREFGNKVYNVVSFKSTNRDGFGDYYSGLAPNCPLTSPEWVGALGDPQESRLAAALVMLAGGSCPVPKSLTTVATNALGTLPSSGVAKMIGLH